VHSAILHVFSGEQGGRVMTFAQPLRSCCPQHWRPSRQPYHQSVGVITYHGHGLGEVRNGGSNDRRACAERPVALPPHDLRAGRPDGGLPDGRRRMPLTDRT
jgi:hypothetical protein